MDQELSRQLVRQLKILNRWVTFFGLVFLVAMVIAGILLFRLVAFMQDASVRLSQAQQQVQESTNLKKQLCDSPDAGTFLKNTSLCQ